jgi:hypothetical protein
MHGGKRWRVFVSLALSSGITNAGWDQVHGWGPNWCGTSYCVPEPCSWLLTCTHTSAHMHLLHRGSGWDQCPPLKIEGWHANKMHNWLIWIILLSSNLGRLHKYVPQIKALPPPLETPLWCYPLDAFFGKAMYIYIYTTRKSPLTCCKILNLSFYLHAIFMRGKHEIWSSFLSSESLCWKSYVYPCLFVKPFPNLLLHSWIVD